MELVTIDYAEFKRLVAQEVWLKARIAELEDDIEYLDDKARRLENELFDAENQLVED
ncbi:hypothetical protein [Staphylococcus coagulans]|uniref:Uncharacterized protein n=1 Tax=Staphylococcus coagulans TaxID=74706 RepID=A0A9X0PID8_9STAP|nr:hypothetical protein [Staphylococcus coagulans]MBA8772087.1 hypothetical protein [Staphylococcus coagulans]MBA8777707.1 hypothetical protein [Staphylococcus coagulans]